MENNEKLDIPPILNCLSIEDQRKIMEYIPYISCDKCKNIMLQPKFCPVCQKNYCEECQCRHEDRKLNRHINTLLGEIKINCKYNCGKDEFPLPKIMDHIKYCRYQDYYLSIETEDKNMSNKNQEEKIYFSDSKFKTEDLFDLDVDKFLQELESKETEKNKNIKCFKCNESFKDKIQFMKHIMECIQKNSNQQKYTSADFEKDFMEYRQKLAETFNSKVRLLGELYLNEIQKTENTLEELKKQKQQNEKILETLIQHNQKIKEDKEFDDEGELDEEYKALKKEEENLQKIKKNLEKELKEKNSFLKGQMFQSKSNIEFSTEDKINEFSKLKTESKILYELISNFSSNLNGECAVCKDDKSEKFICTFCKNKFCKNKCAKKCKKDLCGVFLCPNCTNECNLCHKKIYCDRCKKNCFSSSCPNKFCIECYSLNEHQKRESFIDCKFFICNDEEHTTDCLMTTLYCPKCERRKCNKCLLKEKEHYPYLKIFD